MAKLTPQQFIDLINKQNAELQKENLPFKIAVRDIVTAQTVRIFQDGLKVSGKIGTYNRTKPLYVGSPPAPRKTTQRGKTGKRIKTGFYESYAAFRKQQGRESRFVNLRLSNELQNDFANAMISPTSNRVAAAMPIRVNQNLFIVALKKQINIDKKAGLEAKYGNIFGLRPEELTRFQKTLEFEMNKFLNA